MIYSLGTSSLNIREIVLASGLQNDQNVVKHQSGGLHLQNDGPDDFYFAFNREATPDDPIVKAGQYLYVNAHEYGTLFVVSAGTTSLRWCRTDGDAIIGAVEAGGGTVEPVPTIDTEMTLGVDDNGVEYIRVIQYDSTGLQVAVSWIDPLTGLTTVAPTSFTPNADYEYLLDKTCYTAINAGVGYAVDDTILKYTTIAYLGANQISSTDIWYNNGVVIATPLLADLEPCKTAGVTAQDNIVKLYDYLPSGENIPYFAIVNSDGAGNYITHTPIIYTPTGTPRVDPLWTNIGYESINIDDTQTYTLTIPSGANHADINFIGTTGPLQPIVDYAWYQINSTGPAPTSTSGYKSVLAGQEFDLQGLDELQAFQIIAGAGMSGTINVNYKYNPNMQI